MNVTNSSNRVLFCCYNRSTGSRSSARGLFRCTGVYGKRSRSSCHKHIWQIWAYICLFFFPAICARSCKLVMWRWENICRGTRTAFSFHRHLLESSGRKYTKSQDTKNSESQIGIHNQRPRATTAVRWKPFMAIKFNARKSSFWTSSQDIPVNIRPCHTL